MVLAYGSSQVKSQIHFPENHFQLLVLLANWKAALDCLVHLLFINPGIQSFETLLLKFGRDKSYFKR